MAMFFVEGIPVTKGSTSSYLNKKTGRIVTTSASGKKLKDWENLIAYEAKKAGYTTDDGPYRISLIFVLPKPKTTKNDLPIAKNKNDLDKLTRAVLDGLTGVVYNDDAQVIMIVAEKIYTNNKWPKPGVAVSVFGALLEKSEVKQCD